MLYDTVFDEPNPIYQFSVTIKDPDVAFTVVVMEVFSENKYRQIWQIICQSIFVNDNSTK